MRPAKPVAARRPVVKPFPVVNLSSAIRVPTDNHAFSVHSDQLVCYKIAHYRFYPLEKSAVGTMPSCALREPVQPFVVEVIHGLLAPHGQR